MQIHNTLDGKKTEFKSLQEGKVGMYVCGPTVYDLGHLGHGRSAVAFDVIRKYLIYKGYEVTFVSNFTDIDDKMIKRAEEMKISVSELADKIIPEYKKDYEALGIAAATFAPRATEFVAQMIALIEILEKKGHAYILNDGVYFDVTTFAAYGKLSNQKMDELQSGARIQIKNTKRNPQDFVLWKFSKPGEPKWESPWGEGRPGWHIECSAMGRELLGETFDIHGGGLDLIFPHHECEIAQSESAYEKPFVKYWLHNGFININNEKMSKSLGNFFTLRDILQKYPPQAIRLLFLQTHYRSPIEFSEPILQGAKNGLTRLQDFSKRLVNYQPLEKTENVEKISQLLTEKKQKFEEGLDNDFDSSVALAACFDLAKEMNKAMDQKTLSAEDKQKILDFMKSMDQVLGVVFPTTEEVSLSEDILQIIKDREEARKVKNWGLSDELRNNLLKMNIQIEDTPGGTVWKRV